MSFCKKNHLSYLDTIESGAEEDIFQILQELYIVAYLLSFKRLFLFPKIWKYMFMLKSVTQVLPKQAGNTKDWSLSSPSFGVCRNHILLVRVNET